MRRKINPIGELEDLLREEKEYPKRELKSFKCFIVMPRKALDDTVKEIMNRAPDHVESLAYRLVNEVEVKGLGVAGMKELLFRLGVALNEVCTWRQY